VNQLKYPAVEAYLKQCSIVESWCVDDIVKPLKAIEDVLHKVELTLAKEKTGFWQSGDKNRGLNEANKQMKRLADQMDRLLGISL